MLKQRSFQSEIMIRSYGGAHGFSVEVPLHNMCTCRDVNFSCYDCNFFTKVVFAFQAVRGLSLPALSQQGVNWPCFLRGWSGRGYVVATFRLAGVYCAIRTQNYEIFHRSPSKHNRSCLAVADMMLHDTSFSSIGAAIARLK